MEQSKPTNKFPWLKTGNNILDMNLEKTPTLIEPFFPKVGTVSLAGSSDLGKSYFLLQAADVIVKGETTFLGFPMNVTHKSVIYLSTEDDDYGLAPRLKNLSKNCTDLSVYERLRIFYETGNLLSKLDQLLHASPADMVILDTFSDVYDGDMNAANKVRSFLQPFKELAYKHRTLIVFNHHCGKRNDHRPPHKDNLLGSQGFESSMRTVIELRKDFNNPKRRHLCLVKGNYVEDTFKQSSFVLEFDFQSGFTNTGQRVDFDELVKTDEQEQQKKEELRSKVLSMKAQNLSYTKIVTQLQEEGIKISKSTVGNICKEHRPSIQPPIDDGLDGRIEASQEEAA